MEVISGVGVLAFISAFTASKTNKKWEFSRAPRQLPRVFSRDFMAQPVQNLISSLLLINRDFCSVTIMSKRNEIWFVFAMIIFYSSLVSPFRLASNGFEARLRGLAMTFGSVMNSYEMEKKYWIKHIRLSAREVRPSCFLVASFCVPLNPLDVHKKKLKSNKAFVRDYFASEYHLFDDCSASEKWWRWKRFACHSYFFSISFDPTSSVCMMELGICLAVPVATRQTKKRLDIEWSNERKMAFALKSFFCQYWPEFNPELYCDKLEMINA